MTLQTVGIGECAVSNDLDRTLVVHGLGSCIALLVYDPTVQVAGLLHYMLPHSSLDAARAASQPCLFADTGIPLLFHSAYEYGAEKSRMMVVAVGGAQIIHGNYGAIGLQNLMALRRILHHAGVCLRSEDTGGFSSRTVRIEVATGRVILRTAGASEQEMMTSHPSRRIARPPAGASGVPSCE